MTATCGSVRGKAVRPAIGRRRGVFLRTITTARLPKISFRALRQVIGTLRSKAVVPSVSHGYGGDGVSFAVLSSPFFGGGNAAVIFDRMTAAVFPRAIHGENSRAAAETKVNGIKSNRGSKGAFCVSFLEEGQMPPVRT